MTGKAPIEVWQASTDGPGHGIRGLLSTLAPDERARAASGAPRAQPWAVGRSVLRMVLAGYVGREPAEIAFEPGPHGKPAVAGGPEFSFSASGRIALVAVSRAGPVGVDVERMRPRRGAERIARGRFAPTERAALGARERGERHVAFHHCWAAKEAYAKGIGRGLAVGFDRFSVAGLLDGEAGDRCAVAHARRPGEPWEVVRLPVAEGYAAAVAAPGSDWRPVLRGLRGPGGDG